MSARDISIAEAISEGYFYWEIDTLEEQRLSALLNVDFHSLDVPGTFVNIPKWDCPECAKQSGLDDFVATALDDGIHTKEFIIRALVEDIPNNSRPHSLRCAVCSTPDPNPETDKPKWKKGTWKPNRK